MNCDTCGASYNQQQQQRHANKDAAKKYARENEVEVGIYQEAEEWKFGTVEYLRKQGIPFREVVSQYS